MNEASNFNFNIEIMRDSEVGKPLRKMPKQPRNTFITVDKVINWIRSKGFPPEKEEKLIKVAKSTPHGALYNFVNNYKRFV